MKPIHKLKTWVQKAPDRKVYIEVITALLTVPVMITVLVTNLNNLSDSRKQKEEINPTPTTQQEIIIRESANTQDSPIRSDTNPNTQTCKKDIGPITIAYPSEGQILTENPVPIVINYSTEEYCAVVWSYRINNGPWSEYGSNSLSLYNMPAGTKTLELRVQSTTNQNQKIITRVFEYQPSSAPVDATSSAE